MTTIFMKTTCAHGPVDKVPPDARLLPRLLRRLADRRLRGPRAIHWPGTYHFTTPARGDGYEFTVSVHFTWCVTGRQPVEALVERAESRNSALRDRLLVALRPVSRAYPPYEAALAEQGIARAVDDLFFAAEYDYTTSEGPDGRVKAIDARTTVKLDDTVRDAQRAAWDRRQQADNDHAYASLLVPQLHQLRELWKEFLESGQGEWVTPYAVALAGQPEDAAKVVERMFHDRHAQARELAGEVVRQTEDYGGMNAFELMTRHDTVLHRLMRLMNVAQSPGLPPGPFDDGERGRLNGGGPS